MTGNAADQQRKDQRHHDAFNEVQEYIENKLQLLGLFRAKSAGGDAQDNGHHKPACQSDSFQRGHSTLHSSKTININIAASMNCGGVEQSRATSAFAIRDKPDWLER